jgi:phenylacetate-CoA ligase
LALEGGILGRTDDMIIVRGVNIYPSAVEDIIRSVPEIVEYGVQVDRSNALSQMAIQIEATPGCNLEHVARALEQKFEAVWSLRVPVTAVQPGTLPRYELKAKRWTKVESA